VRFEDNRKAITVATVMDSRRGTAGAALTVLEFQTADGADQMSAVLSELQKQRLITIEDSAVVSWPAGAKRPTTRQLHNLAAAGALNGAFWGMLFGLLFFVPLLGMAVGAAIGGLFGSMRDIGIDDNFIKEVRSKVTPGTSALFLLSRGAVVDRVVEEVRKQGLQFELVASNLTREQEDALHEAFDA
jgi:uncharacterized membrane protein